MKVTETAIPILAKSAQQARKEAMQVRCQNYDWASMNDIFEQIDYAISQGWTFIEGVRLDGRIINETEYAILGELGYKISYDYVRKYTIEW